MRRTGTGLLPLAQDVARSRRRIAEVLLALLLALALPGCVGSRDAELAQDAARLRGELQATRWQLQTLRIERDGLQARVQRAEASAVQLRGDTKLLGDANTQLADAVNRLSYEDWAKVVPDVQLRFSDVDNASRDLDARVVRVLNALGGDPRR